MKTVQEWLIELDEDSIIDWYFAKYPIDFYMLENKDVKVNEVLAFLKERLREFIRRLKAMDTHKSERNIFYAVKSLNGSYAEVTVEMSFRKDILENDLPEHYSWMLCDHSEVMGSLIADTSLTLKNINSVMAEILHEMSFFGFTQNQLEEERGKLIESLNDIEESSTYSADKVFTELRLPREENDERSDALLRAVMAAKNNFFEYWRTREALKIRSQLVSEQRNK